MSGQGRDAVRLVVDENLLGLGLALQRLRSDVLVFGRGEVADLLPESMGDSEWIPVVADKGWVVVTNDRRIRTRPVEAALAIEHGLQVVHMHGHAGQQRLWDQAVRFFGRWEAIERELVQQPHGPLWVSVQAGCVRILPFQPGHR